MYVEVIFETGAHSVASYADLAEAHNALEAHNDRAKKGAPGGPAGQSAERIKEVLVYDKHPNDYNTDATMSTDVALKELSAATSGEPVVSLEALASKVRELASPLDHAAIEKSAHNSQFKMQETDTLKGSWAE